jgi:hypothetical protein
MFEQEDDIVDRMTRQLRRPVSIDPALDARVMQEIAGDARPQAPARRPLLRFWPGLAAAAVLGAVLIARPWTRDGDRPDVLQFVLVAPQAASVSLVGDFNDWDPARSPMRTAEGRGIWATVVQLAPGRYRYAFLVNGVEWRADPGAPRAMDDEFGTPSSVVTVGGRGRGS